MKRPKHPRLIKMPDGDYYWRCRDCASLIPMDVPECVWCAKVEAYAEACVSNYQQRIRDTKAVLDFLGSVFKDQDKAIIAEPQREVRKCFDDS